MKHTFTLLIIFLLFFTPSFCQNSGLEWFISPNGNLYLPSNNPGKGTYPILWYDKETDPKLLIGGMGIGVSVFKPVLDKISLKGQANLSKHTYWDEPLLMIDDSGNPTGDFLAGSSDYSIGVTATLHYFLGKRLSVGTGLGGQFLLISLSRLPELENHMQWQHTKGGIALNRYYKPVMPMLPVELSLKFEKVLFNIRYEYGLLNRLKGDLSQHKKDRFSLLTFEIGFRLK